MIGFEVLFATIRPELKAKNDLIVAVVHWHCIQKGFVCVGVGDNFPQEVEKGSELLPRNWNQSGDTYILRYVNTKTNQKLLIKCVQVSDILIISALVLTGDNAGSTLSVKTDDYISSEFKSFDTAFVSGKADSLADIVEKDVINTMLSQSTQRSTQTDDRSRSQRNETDDPLRIGRPQYPYGGVGAGNQPYYGGQWPPPIGGADLDPLGRGQGGMLMDPRNFPGPFGQPRNPAPGLPPGAVPPGARFDPFGPPGVGPGMRPNRNPRQMGPDPDHLPPPGYDDMFN